MRQTLDEVIKEYLAARAVQYSANTVRNDEHVLRRLMATIGNIQVSRIEPRHIDLFFASAKVGPGTLNSYQGGLRAFFKWCRQRRIMGPETDPMIGRRKIKDPPKRRVLIPQDRFGDVLDAATHPRDRMITALGLYLFLRQGEIRKIRMSDLDLARGELHVEIEKTAQRDAMPICAELDTEIRRWLRAFSEEHEPKPDHYLTPAKTSPPGAVQPGVRGFVRPAEAAKIVPDRPTHRVHVIQKKVLEASGFYVINECGHMLRRSGARALYDRLSVEGHDRAARHVQAMLHHSTLSMTEHYLGIDVDRKMRNDILKGQPMFPRAGNVVDIREVRAAAGGDQEDRGV